MSAYRAIVFRPDAIFVLLRKAYKDSDLGSVCRMVFISLIYLLSFDLQQSILFFLYLCSTPQPIVANVFLWVYICFYFRHLELCRSS